MGSSSCAGEILPTCQNSTNELRVCGMSGESQMGRFSRLYPSQNGLPVATVKKNPLNDYFQQKQLKKIGVFSHQELSVDNAPFPYTASGACNRLPITVPTAPSRAKGRSNGSVEHCCVNPLPLPEPRQQRYLQP
jgi:hypothetical protein